MSLRAIKRKSCLVLLEAAALVRGEQRKRHQQDVELLWLHVVNKWILRPAGPRQDGHRADEDAPPPPPHCVHS